MLQNNRRLAVSCWLVAGIPVFATFLQAIFAILGIDAVGVPIVGDLKQTLDSIEVLDAAGVIFRDNDVTVFVLFIFVALSWLGVGGGMLGLEDRQITYAAAGLVTVFFVLFLAVYSPLFGEDVPAIQLAGFVTLPLLTVGAVWAAVMTYEWEETLEEETAEVLSEARELTDQARNEFQRLLRERLDTKTLEWLEEATPKAVDEFNEQADEFRRTCQDIQDEADRITAGETHSTHHERLQRAKQLRDEARAVDPERRVQTLIETLKNSLTQELRDKFGTVDIRSQYGQPYEVRNVGRYNELDLPSLRGPPVQIGGDAHELGERLAGALESGMSLSDVGQLVNHANDHLSELEEEVKRHEETFDKKLDTAEANLTDAHATLDRMDQQIRDRLSEMLFENRFGDDEPPFSTEIGIRNRIDEAKTDLHACRFNRAKQTMDKAVSDAEQVKSIAIFFSDSVLPTINHGSGSIPIPVDIDADMLAKMRTEITRTYDVEYTVANDVLEIDTVSGGAETPDTVAQEERSTSQPSRSSSNTPTEDVLYLFRELQRAASEGNSNRTVTVQLGEYPEKFSDPILIEELESYCSRQGDITDIEIPDTEPGYIKLTVLENASASRVMESLSEKYREQYG